jgi:hypothetical protein
MNNKNRSCLEKTVDDRFKHMTAIALRMMATAILITPVMKSN